MDTGKGKELSAAMKANPDQIVDELAYLVRDLQELLETYGPTWYSKEINMQIRETLATYGGVRNTSHDWTIENRLQS